VVWEWKWSFWWILRKKRRNVKVVFKDCGQCCHDITEEGKGVLMMFFYCHGRMQGSHGGDPFCGSHQKEIYLNNTQHNTICFIVHYFKIRIIGEFWIPTSISAYYNISINRDLLMGTHKQKCYIDYLCDQPKFEYWYFLPLTSLTVNVERDWEENRKWTRQL
jgi:hypothetical protein